MTFLSGIKDRLSQAVLQTLGVELSSDEILINETRKEFKGDYTMVIFPLVKLVKKSPIEIGNILGDWMMINEPVVIDFEVVQGFLNLSFSDEFWKNVLNQIENTSKYGDLASNGKKVLVEFSSPNTNKPLHLGHIRNILLGWSCSKILEANGYQVIKTQVINDRGIAICKSMVAWQEFGNDQTPQASGVKGDHFVGGFYVKFEQEFKKEYLDFQNRPEGQELYTKHSKEGQNKEDFFKDFKNRYFNEYSELGAKAKKMLIDWESGDSEILHLWQTMNGWVYSGFEETYRKLGVHFDSLYYESDTYLLGKRAVEEGLQKEVFYRLDDGSVWVNLEDVGMDRKIVLRSDGTSVYMTQDIGTAQQRYDDFGIDKMVYTVADEQDYHFKVLFEILKRLGAPYAEGLHHLSYGMVDLPTGKMKSREGTVVDADDLVDEVIAEAREMSAERGEISALTKQEQDEVLRIIGMGALKYFIIKVQAKKRMIFDPKESVDMQGQTGPYIQNACVRIRSVLRKNSEKVISGYSEYNDLYEQEKALIKHLMVFPDVVKECGELYDPSSLANYSYSLAKDFHRFYHDVRILNAESEAALSFRLHLSTKVGEILTRSLDLLGIEVPDRM